LIGRHPLIPPSTTLPQIKGRRTKPEALRRRMETCILILITMKLRRPFNNITSMISLENLAKKNDISEKSMKG